MLADPVTRGADAVSIPEGDPGALRDAARAWRQLARALEDQASRLTSTSATVTAADWNGPASLSFTTAAFTIGDALDSAQTGCSAAATACLELADALEAAQRAARRAKHLAGDADTRARGAASAIDEAQRRASAAEDAARDAATREAAAHASGPTGAAAAHTAGLARASATAAAGRARADEAAAAGDLRRAEDDYAQAVAAGAKANRHAEHAAHAAARVFSSVAAHVRPLPEGPGPAVPVSPDAQAVNPLMPFAHSGFGSPFRGRTPWDVRKQQIADAEAAAAAAARKAAEQRHGGMDDAFGGMLDAWVGTSLGIGDPRTDAYRGNRGFNAKLAMIPTPGSLGRQALRRGVEREVRDEAEHIVTRQSASGVTRVEYKGVTLRNGHLAGTTHPVTGVPFKPNGFPDFSAWVKKEVKVDGLTGNRRKDMRLASQAAGFTDGVPEGYVWHHVEDGRTMQLVPQDIHAATAHTGGAELIQRGLEPSD